MSLIWKKKLAKEDVCELIRQIMLQTKFQGKSEEQLSVNMEKDGSVTVFFVEEDGDASSLC